MSKQITIRLPDELVDFVDAEVAAQHCPSRAALVAAALEHYRERAIGEAIVAGYTAIPDGEGDNLDEFLSAASESVWSED
ncbi:ribbon-helix-helix protein, CopG family [Nocardia uniformis]|uniref:Ribbon-helix-helix protein, CopG family n=1 Tax=Nocardia uniformis TaxID=53432 RepID=A0A849C0F9_9NOCA|nr:ribbon-helix-helix domain-containing protein [Nocardia uniformis]NNH71108.1 ribbon-helix-helix protein, CopG family [Nocardia uniformis]